MHEFSFIQKYFQSKKPHHDSVLVGSGDDGAVIHVPEGFQLVQSVDAQIENVHFFPNTPADCIGYKALAQGLSDLAAMGATPHSCVISVSMPEADEAWIAAFAKGVFECAEQFKVDLIGGNVSKGTLAIHTTVNGLVPNGKALLRSGAQVGDSVYVSGDVTLAAKGFEKVKQGNFNLNDPAIKRFLKPEPRVELGKQLLSRATSCIDVSDGLAQDLQHILAASGVGMQLEPGLESLLLQPSGEAYELCFTVAGDFDAQKIGAIVAVEQGDSIVQTGFQHF